MNHLYLQHSTQDHQVKEILTKVELQEFFIHKYLMRFSPQGAILCVCLQCVLVVTHTHTHTTPSNTMDTAVL